MTKVNLFINGNEYFPIRNVSIAQSLERSIAIKSATINAIAGTAFKDFLLELNQGKILLCQLYINNKLFLEAFINNKLVHYSDNSDGGTEVNIRLLDRFVGIIASDIIASRPKGTLQSFLSDILVELGYTSDLFKNSYQKKISTARDFLEVKGDIDINKPLKAIQRTSLVEESSYDLIGECLAINKVILVSNGYDTLTFEQPNGIKGSVFDAFRYLNNNKASNITSLEKYGEMGDSSSLTPSIVITLNSDSKSTKSDKNSSVISPNVYGIPHIVKLHRVNMQASYQDIQGMMNFSFAGIKARSNSYILRFNGIELDNDGFLFQPNRVISVFDERYGLNTDMVIMNTRLDIDAESGSDLTLNVTFEESFVDNATIKQKGKLLL